MPDADESKDAGTLRKGAVGPVLLAGLGISYVIAGDYAGWNLGLAEGGWGGLMLAVLGAAAMFFALILSLAELAAMIPAAGGGYEFGLRAFGERAAFIAGFSILLEYIGAAGAVAIFFNAYLQALTGFGGAWVYAILFGAFTLIHAAGVGEALRVLLAFATIAAVGLILFFIGVGSYFRIENLTNLPVSDAFGASPWLPGGWRGVWAAFPFATAFFLAVEGVPMAAEEARDPNRTVPRAMIAAMIVLSLFAIGLVTLGPGAVGAASLKTVNDPLIVALDGVGGGAGKLSVAVNVCGLIGLAACLFAALFAYSRQAFALARAGLLPKWLARTNRRQVPVRALVAAGLISYLLALSGESAPVFVVMVTAASLSYLVMLAAHWRLRVTQPDANRPYRTPGGRLTCAFALVMSTFCLVSCFVANPLWAGMTVSAVAIGAATFASHVARSKARTTFGGR